MKRSYTVPRWSLYIQAATHTSYAQENGGSHNERLEFIGDAVLQLCASDLLYRRFPEASEGEMSRMRRQMVNNTFLAELSRELGLGLVVRLGRGERQSGGAARESILAGTYEAFLGAIYLEQGLFAAKQVVNSVFEPRLHVLPGQRNDKLVLQEWCQQSYKTIPEYSLVGTTGPDHNRRFRMSVAVNGESLGAGEGTSKRRAATAAASVALGVLRQRGEEL
jgi:ribonuclease-3